MEIKNMTADEIKALTNDDIDWPATRQAMRLIKLQPWAEMHGHNINTVRKTLWGGYHHKTDLYYGVLMTLRNEGYLRLKSADDVRIAA
jgi:hypothetical protein